MNNLKELHSSFQSLCDRMDWMEPSVLHKTTTKDQKKPSNAIEF